MAVLRGRCESSLDRFAFSAKGHSDNGRALAAIHRDGQSEGCIQAGASRSAFAAQCCDRDRVPLLLCPLPW